MSLLIDPLPLRGVLPLSSSSPADAEQLDRIERTEGAAKRALQTISLTYAVLLLVLKMESRTSSKVDHLSQEIKGKDRTIHYLLDLKKELGQMKDNEPLSAEAEKRLALLNEAGISLWNEGTKTLSEADREQLMEAISAEIQPLHSEIQRTVQIDLQRNVSQQTTITNSAQDILKNMSKHIENVLGRWRV